MFVFFTTGYFYMSCTLQRIYQILFSSVIFGSVLSDHVVVFWAERDNNTIIQ